jgi:glycosyltransferase involved in cell wall biosynthesis
MKKPIKLAILTLSISHFEVPLFRLCKNSPTLELKVFYMLDVKNERFDSEYKNTIDWGENLLEGYESEQYSSANELRQAALDWGADVLLLYGYAWPGAVYLILKNKIQNIPQIHRGTLNYHLDPRRPIKARLMRPLRKFVLAMFDAHHYGGDYSRRVLQEAKVKQDAMFMVPYSVDTPFFIQESESSENVHAASLLRSSLGWSDNCNVLLLICQHNWFKGPDIAMDVFIEWNKRDKNARFLIVGNGAMTDSMIKLANKQLPEGVCHFAGFIPSKKTVPYYLASDLIICSSRYETWARMINEAMLCKRPCLVNSIVPAAGGLIEDGLNGFVIDTPTINNYVEKISTYFAYSAEQKNLMQDLARERALEFSYDKHINEFVSCTEYAVSLKK